MCGPCLRVAYEMNSRIYFRVSLSGRGVNQRSALHNRLGDNEESCVLCSVGRRVLVYCFSYCEGFHNKTIMIRTSIGLFLLCFCVGVRSRFLMPCEFDGKTKKEKS